jgi:hypothetical protein
MQFNKEQKRQAEEEAQEKKDAAAAPVLICQADFPCTVTAVYDHTSSMIHIPGTDLYFASQRRVDIDFSQW